MPSVEQNKVKRSGIGLRAADRGRAFEGFTLFAPLSGNGTVYLIDLDGELLHTWQMPYPPGNYGYLTERGTLFYNGKTSENSARYISNKPWKGGVALEADWSGRVLWEVRHPDHHHDGIRLRNGNVLLICLALLPRDLTAKIKGGLPGTEHEGEMYGDYLVEMTTKGEAVWEWRTWEHLDPETDRITGVQDPREAGLANVETRVMDAENLDLAPNSFDAALCRSALMHFRNPTKTLAGVYRVLKPSGKCAVTVFSSAEKNPFHGLPLLIVSRLAKMPLPGPGEPGMFALSDPRMIEECYMKAGFSDVLVREVPVQRHFSSIVEAVQAMKGSFPRLQTFLNKLSDAERALAWSEIEQQLSQFDGPDGFNAPGEWLVGVGTK